jgi:hypothetical protein
VLIQTLAILNIGFGLPVLPPHYIFDWWGHGLASTSKLSHWIPLPNFTMNPTNYELNFNQYIYIILLFISYSGVIKIIFNFIKWKWFFNESDRVGHDTAMVQSDSAVAQTTPQANNKTINNPCDFSDDLKLLGLSARSIGIIQEKYSPLKISEILEAIRRSDGMDDPKTYLVNQLEGELKDDR